MTSPKKRQIIIHDDFTNFLYNTPGAEDPAHVVEAAHRETLSGRHR